jgi:hypothetical protein
MKMGVFGVSSDASFPHAEDSIGSPANPGVSLRSSLNPRNSEFEPYFIKPM